MDFEPLIHDMEWWSGRAADTKIQEWGGDDGTRLRLILQELLYAAHDNGYNPGVLLERAVGGLRWQADEGLIRDEWARLHEMLKPYKEEKYRAV